MWLSRSQNTRSGHCSRGFFKRSEELSVDQNKTLFIDSSKEGQGSKQSSALMM